MADADSDCDQIATFAPDIASRCTLSVASASPTVIKPDIEDVLFGPFLRSAGGGPMPYSAGFWEFLDGAPSLARGLNMQSNFRQRPLASTIIFGAASLATPACAQEAEEPNASVTGASLDLKSTRLNSNN